MVRGVGCAGIALGIGDAGAADGVGGAVAITGLTIGGASPLQIDQILPDATREGEVLFRVPTAADVTRVSAELCRGVIRRRLDAAGDGAGDRAERLAAAFARTTRAV